MTSRGPAPTDGSSGEDRRQLRAARVVVPDSAFVAPGAVLVGDVTLGERASVWFGCVLRGDLEPIVVGDETNVQDLTVVHVDPLMPATIGRRVTIGHRCVIHGCTIGDGATIGMGAVLLSGCSIGRDALVAAGAVVREGFVVPDRAIVAGVPAVVRGEVDEELGRRFRAGAGSYVSLAGAYKAGLLEGGR